VAQANRNSLVGRGQAAPGTSSAQALVPVNESETLPDGFDKRQWLQQLKIHKRDFLIEDRDRFRPLLRMKKDQAMKDFMEEVERVEKKHEIGLMRERTQINDFVEKQK